MNCRLSQPEAFPTGCQRSVVFIGLHWSSLVILPRVIPPDRPLRGGQRERPSDKRSALPLSVNERGPAFCGASLGSAAGVLVSSLLFDFHLVGAAFAGDVRKYL